MKKLLLILSILIIPTVSLAEELKELLTNVEKLAAEHQYGKALKEVEWVKKMLQDGHTKGLKQYFPDEVQGFMGEPPSSQSAMGFSTYERKYKKGASRMTVSVLGGTGGAAAGGFNPLAAFGQMAAMMGGETEGQQTFRLSGRTANLTVDESAKNSELTVILESGSMLKFEVDGVANADEVKKIAEAFKISELDGYLKG